MGAEERRRPRSRTRAASPVDQVVEKAARFVLGNDVERVFTKPSINSDGEEAIRITIVLKPIYSVSGRTALEAITKIQDELAEKGEERSVQVHFATEDELQYAGTESS
jgi:hypothetical protein